jgi:hypothetical protein
MERVTRGHHFRLVLLILKGAFRGLIFYGMGSLLTTLYRADWQLEIKALDFDKVSTIGAALEEFAHSVRFKTEAAEGGLKAEARRKVTFSPAVPVSRLIEKSALRYRLKGTSYTFELSRYDEYRRVDIEMSEGRVIQQYPCQLSPTPVTSWGASVFDMQWDNVLGEHANYGVGRSAEWRPNLNTFFPAREGSNRAGFSEFLDLVTKLSELLQPNPAKSVPENSGDSKEITNGKAGGVNHSAVKKNEGQKIDGKKRWADILIDSSAIF